MLKKKKQHYTAWNLRLFYKTNWLPFRT